MAVSRGFRSRSPVVAAGASGVSTNVKGSVSAGTSRIAAKGTGVGGPAKEIAGAKGGRAHAGHPRGLINKAPRY